MTSSFFVGFFQMVLGSNVDKVWKRTMNLFNIKTDFWIHVRKIFTDTTLIMLGKAMYLAMILLLAQSRFHNHWSDGNHNAKIWTEIKVNQHQVNLNIYVRCLKSLLWRKIYYFFVSLIYLCTDLYFLFEAYFFISVCHWFFYLHQGFSRRDLSYFTQIKDTISGHV